MPRLGFTKEYVDDAFAFDDVSLHIHMILTLLCTHTFHRQRAQEREGKCDANRWIIGNCFVDDGQANE